MSDELVPRDDLGLTFDPDEFSYTNPQRPDPRPGELYERPDVNFLEEVGYRPVFWFWTGRIPWNKLTVIEGPPQSAKSLVAIELAARASRGEPLPGDPAEDFREFRVQLVSGYDDLHDTVLPRIQRAGGIISNFGQLSRVSRSRGNDEPFARRKLTLPGDIRHFEESISDVSADVVIVDPLTCFCKSGRDVTETLELLEDLASRIGIPIIATLSAKTSRNAIGRWESKPESSDAPARCVWSIVADQDEPGRWLFVPTRMTFATPAEGMAFRIVDGRIAWEPLPALPMAEQDEPVAWLWSVLQEGALSRAHILRLAGDYGYTVKMLRRARRLLKVEIQREGSREKTTSIWKLPAAAKPLRGELVTRVLADSEPAGRIAGPQADTAREQTAEPGEHEKRGPN